MPEFAHDPTVDPWERSAAAARKLNAPWELEPDPVDEANEVAIDHDPYEYLDPERCSR